MFIYIGHGFFSFFFVLINVSDICVSVIVVLKYIPAIQEKGLCVFIRWSIIKIKIINQILGIFIESNYGSVGYGFMYIKLHPILIFPIIHTKTWFNSP